MRVTRARFPYSAPMDSKGPRPYEAATLPPASPSVTAGTVFQGGGGGVPVAELIRKVGISEQTFYRWKKQYVGLEVGQVRQMKQLQEENTRLKQLVAELSLDKTMLQDVLRKKF